MASAYFEPRAPRVLAHRGLALDAPENTLLAFARAVAVGARYLETDVHASHDGVAVVSHDPSLDRVAGRDVAVGQLTMAELRRIDLGHAQGFASLEEALDAFPESRFNIDLKEDAAVGPTVDAITRTRAASRVLLTSFSDRRRRRAAAQLPDVVTSVGGAGVLRFRLAAWLGSRSAAIRALRGARALQVPERAGLVRLVSPRFIETAHRVGVEVHVWTVNEPADMTRLLDLGVDGLVTDRVDLALPLISARS
ncbi:glycerophosphodiester phosphodiesterase [Agromyces sp. SYSU K20354]|uniref:glycerophosphodiester phosphodiesterase n=1 Tax=Agromyces cavernae TaxID=2898659 RepID=UPI001E46CA0C|nr:glycerophosphodiester phosphodiesterase [Agromyces cavernae]MCD2442145.1 glycerophosphodiester phosphodiesterase [Agromyces cavernae]